MSLMVACEVAPGESARDRRGNGGQARDPVCGLTGVHAALDHVDAADASTRTAARAIREVDRAIARLQGVRLALVAAADRGDVAATSGMTGTGAWLAAHTRAGAAEGAADVRLARALADGLPATRSALEAGDLSTQHAQVIATAAAQLPDDLTDRDRAGVEVALVRQARLVDPPTLRRAARRALKAAQRTAAQVDAHEDAVLRSEQDRALDRTRLTLHDNQDGTTTGHFTVPTLAAAILKKAVQQIASPRRFADRAAAQGALTAGAQREAFAAVDWSQRYGQALVELLEHLPTDRLAGKVAASVVVTVRHDQLREQVGAAHLDTGADVSAGEARRLACNAGILPAVLGGHSLPIDLGRADRFFTEGQRVALATAYDTCAAVDCDRPYAWSELHHEDPWAQGGRTDLHLAVPLCGHHHRRIHDTHYRHRVDTGARGTKTVTFTRRT
jgi:hypothetical protein